MRSVVRSMFVSYGCSGLRRPCLEQGIVVTAPRLQSTFGAAYCSIGTIWDRERMCIKPI